MRAEARIPDALRTAFADDHAVLGRGFHELSCALRASDLVSAYAIAGRIDREAAAHIVFEEETFYPELRPLIGDTAVDAMMEEHETGVSVIRDLLGEMVRGEEARSNALARSEAMERHIADCGELFEAMGRIPVARQERMLARLLELREQSRRWTARSQGG